MKMIHKMTTFLGVAVCGLVLNHQMAQTKEATPQATSWQLLDAKSSAQLVARGKKIMLQKGCNTCHGAQLQGKPKFAPSLHTKGIMRKFNQKTFARLMAVGLDEDGEKVKKPMPVYKMKAADSNALYAYLKTVK